MILIRPKTVESKSIHIFPKIVDYINMKVCEISVKFRISKKYAKISLYDC